ncbi:MAG: sugar phosphate isomerase/epimerase family protein [Christensenellales bacterium]|jgi:sugar phosphate isomerase/epimerase
MSGRELGIFLWFGYPLPVAERLRLIAQAGFTSVMLWWADGPQEDRTRAQQADLARRAGLTVANGHLGYERINALWRDNVEGQAVFEGYLADLDALAESGVPVGVLHPSRGFDPPPVSALGVARVRALAERAQRRGVRLAIENMRSPDHLTGLLEAVDCPALGFCYDAGHDFCWSPTPYALLARYGDRLMAVHLHDNHGRQDEHLPPGAGDIDWAAVREGLARSAYRGPLTLEADTEVIPPDRTAQEHLALHAAGARAHLL